MPGGECPRGDLAHDVRAEWVEEIDHERFVRKIVIGRVAMDELDLGAQRPNGLQLFKIDLCRFVQFGCKFNADDSPKWKRRREQDGPPLARAEVDEGELAEIQVAQRTYHFIELCRIGGNVAQAMPSIVANDVEAEDFLNASGLRAVSGIEGGVGDALVAQPLSMLRGIRANYGENASPETRADRRKTEIAVDDDRTIDSVNNRR